MSCLDPALLLGHRSNPALSPIHEGTKNTETNSDEIGYDLDDLRRKTTQGAPDAAVSIRMYGVPMPPPALAEAWAAVRQWELRVRRSMVSMLLIACRSRERREALVGHVSADERREALVGHVSAALGPESVLDT